MVARATLATDRMRWTHKFMFVLGATIASGRRSEPCSSLSSCASLSIEIQLSHLLYAMATPGGPRYDYPLVYEPKGTSFRGKPHRNGFSRLGEYKDKHDERTAHESAMFILSRKNRALPAR